MNRRKKDNIPRNRKKIKKRLQAFSLICLLFLTAAYAQNDSTAEKLRVFYPLQRGFTEKDSSGIYSGYTYEYLMKIAQLTGWQYEFIVAEATDEHLIAGLDAVKQGTIDLIGAMVNSPEAAGEYRFSAVPCGQTNFVLIGARSNKALNSRTVFSYPNLKIALIQKAEMQTQLLNEFCAEHGLNYQPVYAENNSACRELIKNGKADLMISKDVTVDSGFKTVLTFANQPFYFATSVKNHALMAELDRAHASLRSTDPGRQERLYEQYFTDNQEHSPAFTVEELAYLENSPRIRLAVPAGQAPIQDYDTHSSQFRGIIPDIIRLISIKSGLSFELLPAENSAAAQEMIRGGQADMASGVPYSYSSPEQFFQSGLLLTSPILTSPIVRVSGTAVRTRYPETLVEAGIRSFEGRPNIRYETDTAEIFSLIERADYAEAYMNGYMAQYYLERGNYSNVTLIPTPYGSYDLCLAVARANDLRLISILEQVIATLSPAELENIIYENTSLRHQTSIQDIIKRNPAGFVFFVFSIFAIISALLLALLIKTYRLNKLISKEKNKYKAISQTDSLTGIYNTAAFRMLSRHYISEELSVPHGVLLIIDVDNFKTINDTFGHAAGDTVLCGLAKILAETFRSGDIAGRVGGDEFAVLMKNTPSCDAAALKCEELKQKVRLLLESYAVTLSIGGVLFKGRANFETLYQKADGALYTVKRHGKNSYRIEAGIGANAAEV